MTLKLAIKSLLLSLCLVLSISVHGDNAIASDNPAYNFIDNVSNDALQIIKSNISAAQKEEKLVDLFVASVDTKWIARFAIGKYWREATEQQRDNYINVHRKFLLSNYIPKFKEYTNQRIKIGKSYADGKSDNEYVVETQIISKDGTAVNISYKVRKSEDGKYMIFDVIAEGVSLIITQRSDFASILARGGVDVLIKKLGEKI